jgi:glycosyltransferase involved in cell wall biosynthesis
VKRELASWTANHAASKSDENACLLAANFSQDIDARARWIDSAFSASGTDARLSTIDAPIPFEFGKQSEAEDGPLVTVLMSAYNSASTLHRAARSILNQTWRNLELIITDDVSTDDTASVAAALMQEDSRIKVRHNSRNVGPYVSRNTALAIAKGEYITCHDADDIAHPGRIACQMNALAATPACAGNISNWIRVERSGRIIPTSFTSFVQEDYSALLVRREVFDAIGYWDSVRTTADSEYRERIKRRFGKPAEQHIRQILSLGQSCSTTLTGAAATESSWLNYSQGRMRYRRLYKAWHKSTSPALLYMPFPAELRPFEAPAEMTKNTS